MSSSTSAARGSVREAGGAAPDPYLPGAGTNAFRVERYELDLDYRVASNRLAGRAVLHGVTRAPASAIVLDLVGLRATKVVLDGRKPLRFSQRAASWWSRRRTLSNRGRRSPWRSATRAIRGPGGARGVRWAGRN